MDPTIPWLAELRQSSESWASYRGTRKAIPVHNDIFSSPFHELFTFWNSDVHLGSLILCASSSEVPWALLPVYKPHLYCLQDPSSLSLSSSVLQVLECIQVTWGFCFAWFSGNGAAPEILHFQQAPRCHHTSCLKPRLGVVGAFSHRGGTKLSSYCSSKHNILFPVSPWGFLLF